jgi:hypothetical protein
MMMIKKFLIFALVLALCSTASAVSVSLTSGGKSTLVQGVDWTVGQTITVDLVVDTSTKSIYVIDFLVPSAVGTASVGAWSAAMPNFVSPGTLDGSGNIRDAGATCPTGSPAAAGTVLYSFSVVLSDTGLISPYMVGTDYIITGGTTVYASPTGIGQNGLHIVPEPITIALLGLGGLFLRRRR